MEGVNVVTRCGKDRDSIVASSQAIGGDMCGGVAGGTSVPCSYAERRYAKKYKHHYAN